MIRDLAIQRQAFRAETGERPRLMVPGDDPVWGDLGEAFPAWQASGRDAILQHTLGLDLAVGRASHLTDDGQRSGIP